MNEKISVKILTVIIGGVVVAGISFYVGIQYDKGNTSISASGQRAQQFGGLGGRQGGARRTDGGFTAGSVISKDAESMTIQLGDGGSSIVFFTASTSVMKSAPGSSEDIAIGKQVTVMGTKNTDGSITAQSIQLRPDMAPRTIQ